MRSQIRPQAFVPVALLLALGLVAAGCSRAVPRSHPDIRAAREFKAFPLYWLGERFEKWNLTAIDGIDRPAQFVTLIYGTCTPHGGEQPSCTPLLEIQVFPLCWHLETVARAPIWKHRRKGVSTSLHSTAQSAALSSFRLASW